MKYKPQKVYTDERTLQLERKLGNEVAFFAIILLLISIFIKILIWHVPVEGYLAEILIILGMEIYAGIRSWQLGLDIRRYNPTSGIRTLRSRLVNGAILAIVIVAVQMWSGNSALRPFFRHHPILQFIFIVALITAFSSIFDQLVNYFYQKRQVLLDQELENDEN
ncbi:DUF6773 family protein [Streptococcus cristatus]|jgi:hypothetical protein|uniref:DUF6773 family protein n=1 Tax=Streptococcus cristatus TaxID=45634 RepID=UPI001EF36437|nr:DUF6773 family protein [Streptococcus cristatus]MCG7329787.1 hypothetical protein [Streptococcus cristatus]